MTEDARLQALEQRDAAARSAALDVTRSILLQAPAGSGKTTVLVCRVLALLASGEDPEAILAITFSRKAAAEMRERVLRALRFPEHEKHTAELTRLAHAALARDRERRWELLRNPARLRIQTFDALNQRLAAQAPVQSGGGAGLRISEHAAMLYRRAARRVLEGAWEEPALAHPLRRLFAHLDNRWERCESLLAGLLEQRLQWLPPLLGHDAGELATQVERSLATLAEEAMRVALQCWPELGARASAELLATSADHRFRVDGGADAATLAWREQRAPLRAEAAELQRWRHACRLLLTASQPRRQLRATLTKREGVPADEPQFRREALAWLAEARAQDGLAEALGAVDAIPDLPLAEEDRELLHALALLMRRAVAELQLEFAHSGAADFSYIAGAARQALSVGSEPTELALRFGSGLRHLLVDEFQDTSTEQAALLAALTADWNDGDGRTLFLVGDPMQSIYQFRAAEVGVFLQARAHGIGALPLHTLELRRNFRSQSGVVEWVNHAIGPLFPQRDDLRAAAISFLDSFSRRADAPARVQVCAALQTGEAARDAELESRRVLEQVRAERDADPHCSIAVLVAGRAHAVPIAALLRAQGIAVRGVNLTPLAERPCVRDLLMLARALQHPGDRTAWLAVLRSPLCGLELDELQQLAEGEQGLLWSRLQNSAALAALEAACVQRIERLCAALRPALEGSERQEPLAARAARVWLRLGGAERYAADDERADVVSLLTALSAEPTIAAYTGEDFALLLDELYADSAGPADAVQILTMHAAKGLEWDVVIVPGLHRVPQHDAKRLLEWLALPREDHGSELLFGPIEAAGSQAPRSVSGYIRGLRRRRRDWEQRRLLYVTATRARRSLIWLGTAQRRKDGSEPVPPPGSLLQVLWPAVCTEFQSLPAPGAAAAAAPAATGPAAVALAAAPARPTQYESLLRLPLEWKAPDTAGGPTTEVLPIALRAATAGPEYAWVGLLGRAVGTVVHAELQRFAARQRQRALADLPELERDAWCSVAHYRAWLAELGVAGGEREAGAERVLATLRATLDDARGRWLLSHAAHREASSERRLTGVYQGEVVNIVIDRMLIDREGNRWIVDFKTSEHEGGELEAFLDEEVRRYLPQLQRYAALARRLGTEPVRAALYFPAQGLFREVELAVPGGATASR